MRGRRANGTGSASIRRPAISVLCGIDVGRHAVRLRLLPCSALRGPCLRGFLPWRSRWHGPTFSVDRTCLDSGCCVDPVCGSTRGPLLVTTGAGAGVCPRQNSLSLDRIGRQVIGSAAQKNGLAPVRAETRPAANLGNRCPKPAATVRLKNDSGGRKAYSVPRGWLPRCQTFCRHRTIRGRSRERHRPHSGWNPVGHKFLPRRSRGCCSCER